MSGTQKKEKRKIKGVEVPALYISQKSFQLKGEEFAEMKRGATIVAALLCVSTSVIRSSNQ